MISYIPQNVFLTDDKIINNVAFGETPEQINLKNNFSMKTSRIYDFVSSLPEGAHTNCGELEKNCQVAKAKNWNCESLV